MPIIVSMVSQKGGVGKSTLARLLAREFAVQDWKVKIADLDISQSTSYHWRTRRLENQIEPDVPVEQFGRPEQALKIAEQYDLLIFDGAPHATQATKQIALASDLIIIPTGPATDDLRPAVVLAHDLVKAGVPKARIMFALCRVGDSELELTEARGYIEGATYAILPGALPNKVGYTRASDDGRALSEAKFPSLRRHAEELAQGMIDAIQTLAASAIPKAAGSVA